MSRRVILVLSGLAVLAAVMVGIAQLTGGEDATLHPLGTEVVVGYQEPKDDGSSGERTQFGLTIVAVRRGTQEELEANGIEVEPEDRTATPYYVDARFTNRGPSAVERAPSVGLEDSDGNTFRSLIVFGGGVEPFEPCPEASGGGLEPGGSGESCSLILVPDGLDVAKVYYLSDHGPDKEPEWVYWAPE